MTAVTEPLATWDSREKSWIGPQREARTQWLRDHGLPADNMYRVEFYLAGAPFVRVFTYKRNERGRRYLENHPAGGAPHDHDLCEVAVNPAYDEATWELPPEDLW